MFSCEGILVANVLCLNFQGSRSKLLLFSPVAQEANLEILSSYFIVIQLFIHLTSCCEV